MKGFNSEDISYEEVSCDLCGIQDAVEYAKQGDVFHETTREIFTVVSCKNCGLRYTNPRPDFKSISKFYSNSYSYHESRNYLKRLKLKLGLLILEVPILPSILSLNQGMKQKLISLIRPNIEDPVQKIFKTKSGRFLDIGSGSGYSANFWGEAGSLFVYKKNKNIECSAVEIGEKARKELIKNKINAFAGIDMVPSSDVYDVIRMNWSLEHVHEPSKYFSFVKKHLVKNGKFVITVPNYDGLIYRLNKNCIEVPIHLYHFGISDILKYASNNNLSVELIKTFSYPGMFDVAAKAKLIPEDFHSSHFTLTEAKYFQRILNRLGAMGMGNDMLFVLSNDREE